MAKKKKQLKPVARGYAVTSIPKRPSLTNLAADHNDAEDTKASTSQPTANEPAKAPDRDDSKQLIDPTIQDIMEKLQEKTEREIARCIKLINGDLWEYKVAPKLEIDPHLAESIIDLGFETIGDDKARIPVESEEKLLLKIGVTYGTLRRLGFSEERVTQCLGFIAGIELEDAWDWNLDKYVGVDGSPSTSLQTTTSTIPTPRTPHTPAESTEKLVGQLNPQMHESTPPAPYTSRPINVTSIRHDGDSEAAIVEYVRAKLELLLLTQNRNPTELELAQIAAVQGTISSIKNDVLFDEATAEKQYQREKGKLRDAALRARLRGESTDTPPQPPLPQPSTLNPVSDALDDDDALGGLFDRPDDTIQDLESGSFITIRDLAIPKNWSGHLPKAMLQEAAANIDRYAVVSYEVISGQSRAKRASVQVRWTAGGTDSWRMEDVACTSSQQAENYIATIVLHALTYPPIEGFPRGPSMQVSFRLLPATYRDLWYELEEGRKAKEELHNSQVWTNLRSLLSIKLQTRSKAAMKERINEYKLEAGPLKSSDSLADAVNIFAARKLNPNYIEMLAYRSTLPIASYRNHIIDLLDQCPIIVLSGETGCGKSTQVPSFILEDRLARGQPCKIICTEPRRISAISLAQRVSRELGEVAGQAGNNGSLVGYSIRLENKVSRTTRLIYATNGIALRMLERGDSTEQFSLDEVTHIIIDEVHERTIESDFLLIVLKSLLQQRPDIRVILMSATVDAQKISAYFDNCPMVHVPGRTFPVDVSYLEDAIELTRWTISESSPYALRGKVGPSALAEDLMDDDEESQTQIKLEKKYSAGTLSTLKILDERTIPYDLIISLLEQICFANPNLTPFSAAILIFMPGIGEIRRIHDALATHPSFGNEEVFQLYPLHSTLSSENQAVVFDVPPAGVRKIVIATNIAETGVTIPDITCVIDSGKHREMRYDEKRQISRLIETFIAKSNALQRRGRAGRVQPGLCFHLFTKARYDTRMAEHPLPEMMRLSLSDLALRIKIMKVNLGSSIGEILSKALDPPTTVNVQRAINVLVEVRALTTSEELTPMGRLLSKLPTDVHLGKFLLVATVFRCLNPALTIAAALNSKSIFNRPFGMEQQADMAKSIFKHDNSDFLTIHNAFSSWRRALSSHESIYRFCQTNYLNHQNLQQVEELRQQFLSYLADSGFIRADPQLLRQLSRARYGRNRTHIVTVPAEYNTNASSTAILSAALAAGLYPNILSIKPDTGEMRTISNNQPASFHPSSVNSNRNPLDLGVNFMSYFTLMRARKLYASEVGPADNLAILLLCGESDFKLISNTASVDRKIRYRVATKTGIALKLLRNNLNRVFERQYSGKELTEMHLKWQQLALMVLGKGKATSNPIKLASAQK
ncbi:hypothetical protein AX16_009674 [Volvariella volvacea WC 439]|nr:hypothetical protein AX16_009674 [Volvariella volvacea WC 439]